MSYKPLHFVENIIFSKVQAQVLYKAIHRDKDLEIFLRFSVTAPEQQPIYRVSELAYRYKHSPCVCVFVAWALPTLEGLKWLRNLKPPTWLRAASS